MKRWVIAAIAVGAVGVGAVQWQLKPMVLDAAPGLIDQAVAENVNGAVEYDKLDIGWNLDALADGITVRDKAGLTVAHVDRVRVSWSLWRLVEYLTGNREAVGVVDGITLQKPVVYLREEADKTWNITHLLREKEEETPMSLRAKVIVNEGQARLIFQDEPSLSLDRIQAVVDLNDYPTIGGDVHFDYENSPVHVKGNYTSATEFMAEIGADRLPLILARRVLPADLPLHIEGGDATQVGFNIKEHEGILSYQGKANVENGAVTYGDYHISEVNGHVRANTGSVSFHDTLFRVNGEPGEIQGTIQLGSAPAFEIDVATKGMDVSRLAAVPLHGPVAARVHIGGTADAWQADGVAALQKGAWQDTPLRNVFAKFLYRDGVITVSDAAAGLGDGQVRGSGFYNLKTTAGEGEFQAQNADLSYLPIPGYALTGTADAIGNLRLRDGGLDSLSLVANGTGIGANGMVIDTMQAAVDYADGAWRVNYANGTMGEGAFTASGTADSPAGIDIHAHAIPLARFAGLAAMPLAGTLDLDGKVRSVAGETQLDAQISAVNGQVHGLPFRRVHGEIGYAGGQVALHQLRWEDQDGAHTVNGEAHLSGDRALQLCVLSEHVRVENLLAGAGFEFPVTGWLNNAMNIHGTVDAPQVNGQIHLWDGSVLGELYQSASMNYRYNGGRLYIDQAIGQMYNGNIYANGRVEPDDLDLQIKAEGIDIDRVLREKNTQNIQGRFAMSGHLYGSPAKPALDAQVYGVGVSVNNEPIDDVKADIAYHNGIFSVDQGYVRQHEGTYDFSGTYVLASQQIRGSAQVNRADVGRLMRLANVPAEHINGTLAGEVKLSGSLANPSLSVKGQLLNGTVYDKPIGQTDLDLDYANRKVTVRTLRMAIGDGILAALGTADFDGDIQMQVAANNVDVSYLTALAKQPDIDLTGKLNFSAVFQGKTKNPEMDMSFEMRDGIYNGMSFNRFIGLLNMRDNVIFVNQTLLQREPYQLSIYGTVPVVALTKAGRAANQDESMNLQIRLDKADLDLMTAFVPAVTSASGETKGGITISGTLADPHADGRIYVENGNMTIQTMAAPLTDINLSVDFHGKWADWKGSVAIGGGTITTKGDMQWSNLMNNQYQGEVKINHINPRSTYYDGPLDGEFQLSSYNGYPFIKGKLDIEKTKFDIPFTLTSEEGGTPIYLDIDVHVGDKVRLYNSYMYDLYLTGDIHAGGSTAAPDMSGKITALKGHLKYLNNKFKVNKASAEFGRSRSFLPYLSVDADTKFNRYRIHMEASGMPDALDLKLSSEPALTQEEIITMLTLHTEGKLEDLGKEDTNIILGAAAQMILFGGLEGRLQNMTGLDMINITTGSIDPFETDTVTSQGMYNIEIGKYLFDDFMLVLAQGVNNEQRSVGFRYDLNRSFQLSAWANNEDNWYTGANWQRRF